MSQIDPCCRKVKAAYAKAITQEEKNAIVEKYRNWELVNLNRHECDAYTEQLETLNDVYNRECSSTGGGQGFEPGNGIVPSNSDVNYCECCEKVAELIEFCSARKKKYCSVAGIIIACPF